MVACSNAQLGASPPELQTKLKQPKRAEALADFKRLWIWYLDFDRKGR